MTRIAHWNLSVTQGVRRVATRYDKIAVKYSARLGTNRLHPNCLVTLYSQQLLQSEYSEKVAVMTPILGKLTLVIAALGGISLAVLSPAAVEAGVIHPSPGLAAVPGGSDVVRVRCERSLSNLWSCNDDVRGRKSYAYHRCDHYWQIARDGSLCGNRAADRRRGGR